MTTTTKTMAARYPGKCSVCSGHISVGDQIEWTKGEGARHVDCSSVGTTSVPAGVQPVILATAADRRRRLAIRAAVRGEDVRPIGYEDDEAGYHGQTRYGRTYRTM
jgi:hypothetical protein